MSHAEPVRAASFAGASSAMTVIAALLENRTGQQIDSGRAWRIEANLKPILRDLGMTSLHELVAGLVAARDGKLSDRVVDALLNQETSFFREAQVFELIADALPALRVQSAERRLRLWSAGCSNGQEPLSLAMLLDERGLAADAVEIVATDVSTGAVARARQGRYSQFEIQRGLSMHRMMKWFEGEGAEWIARRDLVQRIQFRENNLASDMPPAGTFDLAMCRNVLLYFSPLLRAEAFERIAHALRPGGLLVLGASETVIGQTERFRPSQRWRGLYERV